MRKILILTSLAIVFVIQDLRAEVGVTDASIRIGMVNAQTGPAGMLGQQYLQGAAAVFNSVNSNGGINGRLIDLVVADDGYEPHRTIDSVFSMIDGNDIFSFFGFVGTPTSKSILPLIVRNEIPLFGLFTGAAFLREPVIREVFNVRSSYNDEAESLVDHFIDNGAESVGVFYQSDSFGFAVLTGVKKALNKHGMEVSVTGTYERNTNSIDHGLSEIMKNPPDALVLVGTYTPLGLFIKKAREKGLQSQFATVSFVGTEQFVDAVGDEGDGVLVSQVVPHPSSEEYAFVNECRDLVESKADHSLDYVSLEGCISAKLLVEAFNRSGKELSRNKFIETLESMRDVDIGGMTVSFSGDNHQAFSKVFMTQIQNGRIVKLDGG